MKKFYLMLLGLVVALYASSQSVSVSSFKLLDTDLTANTAGTMELDQNGETAALIKVVTTQTGFTFDGGALGIVKTVQKPSEIWVYVPRGLKKITISHPQLGILRDYYLSIPVEAARTYEMVLVSGEVQTIVKQTRTSQYVVFQLTPPDAVVELNGELLKTEGGVASKMMKFGTYSYRVQAPDYLLEAGSVTIDDPENKKVVNVSLKPNFAQVTIKVDNNAEIWVNGEKKGEGEWSGNLGAGTYELEAKKKGHNSTLSTYDFVVSPEPQIVKLQSPIPVYGEADINSSPGMADIFIDGVKVGQTPQFISKILIGEHDLRISKSGYEDYVSSFVINEKEPVNLQAELKAKVGFNAKVLHDASLKAGNYLYGFVNTEEITKMMPEYSRAKTEIDALQARYETELKSMQDELQKGEAFDKEQAALPENIKQRRQQELQDMYQKIQQSYQDNQQALQKASQEKMQVIQAKVLEAIKSVGSENRFAIIYEDNSIPFINHATLVDVTSAVKKQLNLSSKGELNLGNSDVFYWGFVNTEEITNMMPEYSRAKTEIDALQARYETELKSMQEELQKKGEAFDKEQATLPDNIKQRRQQELQEMYQKIQQSYQDNQQALQKASQEKMQVIQAKVLEAIKSVGSENRFAIIYEDNSIPFINHATLVDVTSAVKKQLNLSSKGELNLSNSDVICWGFVNTEEIIKMMPEYSRAKTEIDALQARYETELKSMQDELQKAPPAGAAGYVPEDSAELPGQPAGPSEGFSGEDVVSSKKGFSFNKRNWSKWELFHYS